MKIRHEEYSYQELPVCFFADLVRTKQSVPPDINWHDALEIQVCNAGRGKVFVDGAMYNLDEKRLVVVNSNLMHYTLPEDMLNYSAMIISAEFCKKMGFDCENMNFDTVVEDEYILTQIKKLQELHKSEDILYSTAKQTALILHILICLSEKYSKNSTRTYTKGKAFSYVKSAIGFIHDNYNMKIRLDDISKALFVDKYYLSREFKEKTGKTIIEYINIYRCNRAASLITDGLTVSEAASLCGFDNFSYFTKTFKRIVGILPSKLGR